MSQKSGEVRYQYQSKTVEIEGYEFALHEPKFLKCKRAVRICLRLIGNPDALLGDLRELLLDDSMDPVERASALGRKMSLNEDRYEEVSDEDILALFELTTDKDAAWFDEHDLSGPATEQLIAEVASILPFAGVWVQKGDQAGAIVTTYLQCVSEAAATSSGNGADGDQPTSPSAESSGARPAPVALRSGTPEPS